MNMTAGIAHAALPAARYGNVFRQFPATVRHLGHRQAGAGNDPEFRAVQNGANGQATRNFVWLPYHPGQVTLVPFAGNISILTGWMNGCWLALVQVGGANFFAHVGTDTNAWHPNTVAVKNQLKVAIGTGDLTVTRAFQPICPTSPNTVGVVSPNRNFYTLGISPSPTSQGIMKMQIDSKLRIAPSPSLPPGY